VFLTLRSRQSLRRQNRLAPVYAIANGALQAIADTILQPVIVLAAITFLLGGSNREIAAFAVIALAAWSLAPVVTIALRAVVSRPYLIVFAAGIVRIVGAILIGFVGFRIDDLSTGKIVGTLLVAWVIYEAGSALAGQASAGLVVTSVGRHRQSSIFRRRSVVAIVAAVAAALACRSAFGSNETFQTALGLVLLLAALAALAATWFQLSIPGGVSLTPSPPITRSSLVAPFRTVPFRRFIAFKVLLALVAAVDPFLVVYGFRELGLQVEYIGLALVAYTLGHLAGQLVWPRWIAGHSPRIPFQVATLLRLLLLTWILAVPELASSSWYTDRFDDLTVAMRGFAIGFALLGLAANVGNAANQRYLLDIVPRGATQGPILVANIIAAITAFAPFGVAWLLGRYDLERILWAAVGVAIVALLASGLLVESRVRVRAAAGSWRIRPRHHAA